MEPPGVLIFVRFMLYVYEYNVYAVFTLPLCVILYTSIDVVLFVYFVFNATCSR